MTMETSDLRADAPDSRRGHHIVAGIDPVILAITAFFVVHMLIRIFGSSNFSVDEIVTAVHTQTFELSYSARNPPLFDWLFYGLSRVTGVNLWTYQILKTALLSLAGTLFYLAVRPAFRRRAALHAAMLSYGATVFYGWDLLLQYSHTVALILAMALTLFALLRVMRLGRKRDYVLLGLGLGLGIMSKYPFLLFAGALLAAGLRSKDGRAAILSPRMAIPLVVALVVLTPFLIGLSGKIDDVASVVGGRMVGRDDWFDLALLGRLLLLSAAFLLPYGAIFLVCLARWPAGEEVGVATPDTGFDPLIAPLLRDATLVMVAATLGAALFLGSKVTEGHYLAVVLSFLPVILLAAVDRRERFPALAVQNYSKAVVLFIVGLGVVRFALFLFVAPPFCVPRCVVFVDYTPVVEAIGNADGKQNVIIADRMHMAANLLRLVPNARVTLGSAAARPEIPLAKPAMRNCFFIWFQKYRGSDEVQLVPALEHSLGRPPTADEQAAIGPVDYVKAEWQTKLLWDQGPDTTIGIARIASEQTICGGDAGEGQVRSSGPG